MSDKNATTTTTATTTATTATQHVDVDVEGDATSLLATRGFQCPVCLNVLVEPVRTACNHFFCKACLEKWISQHTSNGNGNTPACPVDRQELGSVAYQPAHELQAEIEDAIPEILQARVALLAESREKEEQERREAEQRDRQTKLRQLKRHFYGTVQLDEDALWAVIEMCGGDVNQAKTFLEFNGSDEEYFDVAQYHNSDGVPADFHDNGPDMPPLNIPEPTSILHRMKQVILTAGSTIRQHMELFTEHTREYKAVLTLALQRNIDLHQGCKARVLAVALAKHDKEFVTFLLSEAQHGLQSHDLGQADVFGLAELLKAVKLLDTTRAIRTLERKAALASTQAQAFQARIQQLTAASMDFANDVDGDGDGDGDVAPVAVSDNKDEGDDKCNVDKNGSEGNVTKKPKNDSKDDGDGDDDGGDGVDCKPSSTTTTTTTTAQTTVMSAEARKAHKEKLQHKQRQKERLAAKLLKERDLLQPEEVPGGSLSGAQCKFVRSLVRGIPVDKMEYFALQFPGKPWQELADLIHLHPVKDVSLPWFLPRAFGEEPPQDTIVAASTTITRENVHDFVTKYHPPYSFLRVKINHRELTSATRNAIAAYAPVDVCLWWLEELRTDGFDEIVAERIKATGERAAAMHLNYGKTMERLLYLQRASPDSPLIPLLLARAEEQLQGVEINLESPVAVLGDASYSMDVAIRVSVIISSVVAARTQAELRFFNTSSLQPEITPTTAADVLRLAACTKADLQTAPASALAEFYNEKKVIKCFVVVTDEKENLKHEGMYFHQLFYKYYTEVYPAKLVLVSFLEANQTGMMAQALRELGLHPITFSLDAKLPDLKKLDSILGLLATEGVPTTQATHDDNNDDGDKQNT